MNRTCARCQRPMPDDSEHCHCLNRKAFGVIAAVALSLATMLALLVLL